MISFQGNRQILKSAKLLETNSRNLYPHISTSRIRTQIGIESPDPKFFSEMKKEYRSARQMIRESRDIYTALINNLQFGRIGNCSEDSMLTELLGKVNGQKNIYTGSLSIDNGKEKGSLNHVVAFITNRPIRAGREEFFKNKDAIIIDTWLGVTDFAENYFTKLKSVYRKVFMYDKSKRFATLSDDNPINELIRLESKTVQEYKARKKEYCPSTKISIVPFIDDSLNAEKIKNMKETFPELALKNFKKIVLPKKKQKTANTDKIA